MQTLHDIKSLLASDIAKNNQFIVDQLSSDVVLINQISQYIVHSGGKRLRPLLVMLAARALNYQGEDHFKAAAIIEFIHTATLLHDDVVDDSALRRGKETANNVFGNAASVLTGDFLYSRAFQMMVVLNNMDIMRVLADATNKISEGEVLQLLNCHNPRLTEAQYKEVIYCKTAKLFEAACDLAAILSNADEKICEALHVYGQHLGNAFQIADDVLDYTSDAETMGKNMGDDLIEGKTTLPVIYALELLPEKDAKLLSSAIEKGNSNQIETLFELVQSSGAIEKSVEVALKEAALAKNSLECVQESAYKNALVLLADLAVRRVA